MKRAEAADAFPHVSVVIPTRPSQEHILAVEAARTLDYPPEKIEILVARGRQPAAQRNHALKIARGEWIYFLDDDSAPRPHTLRRAAVHFREPRVQVIGGPNLCPSSAPLIEKIFAVVLGSWIAFGPSRARYAAVGKVRTTTEKELILCNLLARRQTVLDLGGFDEALYPNEENALMDRIARNSGLLFYDPEVIVERRPRRNLRAFCKMLFTYGRGRAEQFRRHPTPGSILNFIPAFFCLYLAALPLLGTLGLWPLSLYGAAIVIQTAASTVHHGIGRSLAAAPLLVLTHIAYGLGFWRGWFTSPRAPGADDEITIEHS